MDTSNGDPDYPPRLFEVGKAPFQNHSMNHNCYFNKFSIVRESLGDEVWESLKESSVGVILKFSEMKYIFSSKTVHHFLTNQLQTTKLHEMWSVIGGQPIRFSLHEFSEITGLKCHPFEDDDTFVVDHIEFWDERGVSRVVGPCWEELVEVLSNCTTWSFSKRKMVGLLCVLSVGIFGLHKTSRISLNAAKRFLDFNTFETFSWGRVVCGSLVSGVKVVTYVNDSYHVKGLVHVLQVWAYESVKVLGQNFGKIREDKYVLPLLRWKGSRDRFNLGEIIEKEIETHGKVRVRNLCIKPVAEIYPEWVDDVEDSRVHNLIEDLLQKCFSPTFYDAVRTKNVIERKSVSSISSTQKSKKGKTNEIPKSQKDKTPVEEGVSKVFEEEKNSTEGFKLEEIVNAGISKMLMAFSEKTDSIEVTIGRKLVGLEASWEAKLEEKQVSRMEQFEARVEKFEIMVESICKRGQPSEFKEEDLNEVVDAKKDESSLKNVKQKESSNKEPVRRSARLKR